MADDAPLFRYQCVSCGFEDYLRSREDRVARTVRRRCPREYRRRNDRTRKRFVLQGAAGF